MQQPSLFNATPPPESSMTVSEITRRVRDLLETAPDLQGVTVQGEISNLTRAPSGHWYFSLKDDSAQIKGVMWRSAVQRQSYAFNNGDQVEAVGKITVYEPRGEYQLQVERVRPRGLGDLYAQLEALKAKLSAEGLFDEARKRPLPILPRAIGIVTSPTTAAFQDVQNVLRRRFPMTHLILSPTLVQGIDAPPQIVRAIERLNTYGQVDVILLIRGGGSLEDLWCFNDERVARAVAASTIPVITGVGHEIDFTLVDFVSDLRAPTPSAAAEQATPHIDGVREALRQRALALTAFTQSAITTRQDDLRDVLRTFAYVSPEAHIRTMRQQIDTYAQRAERAHNTRHTLLGERLRAKVAALEAANPQALLKRGYALVRRADGSSVSQVSAVNNGDRIVVHVSDGTFDAEVKK